MTGCLPHAHVFLTTCAWQMVLTEKRQRSGSFKHFSPFLDERCELVAQGTKYISPVAPSIHIFNALWPQRTIGGGHAPFNAVTLWRRACLFVFLLYLVKHHDDVSILIRFYSVSIRRHMTARRIAFWRIIGKRASSEKRKLGL